MNNITIYNKKNNALGILKGFENEFKFALFPDSVITNTEKYTYLFGCSANIFNSNMFEDFKEFLFQNGQSDFYMFSAYSNNFDWYQYELQHLYGNKVKINTCPVVKIKVNSELNFETFNEKIEINLGFKFVQCYIVATNYSWVIHNVPERDFMIMFYNKDIVSITDSFVNDRLSNLEELINNSSEGFNNKEIKSLKNNWKIQ